MTALRTALILATAALLASACTPNGGGSKSESRTKSTPTQNAAAPSAGTLTPERLAASPSISGTPLRRAAISPDGSLVTVLQGRKDNPRQQDLWGYDLETGEGQLLVSSTDLLGAPETLSAEEKNRRERAREYGSGIISYSWVGEDLLLFPLGGDLYLYNLSTKTSRQVTATKGFETDPKVSADGNFVAYVRENNLYIKNLKSGLERQLTDGATDLIRNATASFVVQEELDRSTGYWLSPDASKIAYTQIDESPIAVETRIEYGANAIGTVSQRYPFAGTENARVKLGITARTGGPTVWANIGEETDIYLTRVTWSEDGQHVFAGVLSRDHKEHTFYKINAATGASDIYAAETSPTWLNIGPPLRRLKDGDMLWQSERSGKNGLYRISSSGRAQAITPADLLVTRVNCVNSAADEVFVTGWRDNPLERHIFKTVLSSGETTQITTRAGWHGASFNKDCSRYIGSFSSQDTPPQTRAFKADGSPLAWLNENALGADHPYDEFLPAHISPEYGQIPAADGQMMDYMLFKPKDLKPGEKRPAITLVYGGPGVQRVNRAWGRKQFANVLAQHGFIVFMLDNRGASGRGKAFEDVLYRSMGQSEVVDQSLGAEWLRAQDFVDADKMGIYGWSYGGYMTLHMLAQTDYYASGVSGAPVTDWALYDTAYTERYLGSPVKGSANYTSGAYEEGSVFAHLDGLTEPLLLIHGMADDNVVFRHSIKLMDAMQKRGAHNMRLMTYPGEKHGFRAPENRSHRDRQILDFFLSTLGSEAAQN